MTDIVVPNAPPVFQQFLSQDGEPRQSIQTRTIGRSGDPYIYWSDIQDTFDDVYYLLDHRGERVFFEVVKKDDDYEL